MSEFHIEDLTVRGKVVGATFDATPTAWGNDGIGSYEYWGFKGFDRGRDYVEEWDYDNILVFSDRRNEWVKPSDRLMKEVVNVLDTKYNEMICETLTEKHEGDNEPDYEPDYD